MSSSATRFLQKRIPACAVLRASCPARGVSHLSCHHGRGAWVTPAPRSFHGTSRSTWPSLRTEGEGCCPVTTQQLRMWSETNGLHMTGLCWEGRRDLRPWSAGVWMDLFSVLRNPPKTLDDSSTIFSICQFSSLKRFYIVYVSERFMNQPLKLNQPSTSGESCVLIIYTGGHPNVPLARSEVDPVATVDGSVYERGYIERRDGWASDVCSA